MSTYFTGSQLDAFSPSVSGVTDSSNGVDVGDGYADAYVVDPLDGTRKGVTRLWTHCVNSSNAYGADTGLVLYTWLNSAGMAVLRLISTAGDSRQLSYWNGSAWLIVGDSVSSRGGTYDFLVVVHPTAGRLAWFLNGNLAADVRGLDTSGLVDVARLRLGRLQTYIGATSHRECILASYNTIGHTVRRRAPSGPGARQDWSGTYADVDEDTTNDADAITAATVGDKATFTAAAFSPVSTGNVIKSVVVAARIRNDGEVVPTNARAILRINGVDYLAPANVPITAGFSGTHCAFDTDPTTGKAWASIANVNSEFGLAALA